MTATTAINSLYKKNFSKMVIALSKYTGLRDLATTEDIVQEAFAEAARTWDTQLPEHPEAWLYRVCRNIAFNKLRDDRRFETREVDENTVSYQIDRMFESGDGDDQLRMLLACTHPNFSPKNQVIFALRYVAGFRIEQVANILGSPADTISKTLLRMRDMIVKENINFESEVAKATPAQKEILIKIVYLMFSEGSKTSGGRSILNLELCEDALGLGLAIAGSASLSSPEAHALIALMLFNLSRFEARFDSNGDLVELEHQGRSLWNRDMIKVGVHHITLAGDGNTSYHFEAAIAWLHVSAASFAATDWKKIAALYEKIIVINDSPFVRMNHSIALFYAGDVLTALHQLKKLGESAFMQRHYLFHMALGKVYTSTGDRELAVGHFIRAVELSPHEVEKKHIRKAYLS
ncbi:MAG TPA: sigma-70 family RNA polymerase sigma factor [Cyclobacteriaceae bacterium]|nr:sigma-70 family RNA polymerase sigma factor [Cyclobacteriaceae bacterium]